MNRSQNSRKLTARFLVGSRWRYGHSGKAPATEDFRFMPTGRIGGYNHHNERSWRLENGYLSLYNGHGQRTVQFDNIIERDGQLAMEGRYEQDLEGQIILRLEQSSAGAELDQTQLAAIGYSYNDGGINNQKLALLGLLEVAREINLPVVLPRICIMDQVSESRRTVEFGRVFSERDIINFANKYNINIVDGDPDGMPQGGWEYFAKGSGIKSTISSTRTDGDFARDFFRSVVPKAKDSYLLRQLKSDIFMKYNIDAAAQFRIEPDWKIYAETILSKQHDSREDFYLDYNSIARKIKNSCPEYHRILVICDEAALEQPKESIRDAVANNYEINLIWKSDFLGDFEMMALSPLELSLLDFEMAVHAPIFIGNTRSTFSNLVSVEKFCRTGSPVCGHYFYNTNSEYLALRKDNGVFISPAQAATTQSSLE